MLVIDSRNPQAVRVGSRLSELLPESVLEAAPHIVVGGDGFLLRTAAAGEYTGSYLGLNTGNLGFLLNDVGDIEATAKAIAEGQYEVYAFPLLSAQLVLENGEVRQRGPHGVLNAEDGPYQRIYGRMEAAARLA